MHEAEENQTEQRQVGSRNERPARNRNRTQKRTQETRGKLIAAAIEIFAEMGFKGAGTRQISARAGVSLAALPYHFETKEHLWKAAVDDLFARFHERLKACIQDIPRSDERKRRRTELREFVIFCSENPELMRILVHEGTRDSPALRWFAENHLRSNFEAVGRATETARENDYEVGGRPAQLYFMMLGASSLIYVLAPAFQVLSGRSATEEQLINEHAEAIVDLFYP